MLSLFEIFLSKYVRMTLTFTIPQLLFTCSSQICEIPRNYLKIRSYSSSSFCHPMSSALVPIESALCDFNNTNFGPICYLLPFSRHCRLILENVLFPRSLPCLTFPLGANPLEFLNETFSVRTRGMRLLYTVYIS